MVRSAEAPSVLEHGAIFPLVGGSIEVLWHAVVAAEGNWFRVLRAVVFDDNPCRTHLFRIPHLVCKVALAAIHEKYVRALPLIFPRINIGVMLTTRRRWVGSCIVEPCPDPIISPQRDAEERLRVRHASAHFRGIILALVLQKSAQILRLNDLCRIVKRASCMLVSVFVQHACDFASSHLISQ